MTLSWTCPQTLPAPADAGGLGSESQKVNNQAPMTQITNKLQLPINQMFEYWYLVFVSEASPALRE